MPGEASSQWSVSLGVSRVFLFDWGRVMDLGVCCFVGDSTFLVIGGGAFNGGWLSRLVFFVEVFEVGDAPATSSSCSEAFGNQ